MKDSKPKIVFATQDKLISRKEELDEVYTVFGIDKSIPSFTSDQTTLSMIVCAHINHAQAYKKYENYILTKLLLGFGCTFTREQLHEPLPKLLDYIKLHKTIKNIEKVDYYWMDIVNIETNEGQVSATWVFLTVETYLYQKGYSLTIKDSKFSQEVKKSEEYVYEKQPMVIHFTNGSREILNSYFDAYCFLIARVSNYQQGT